MVMGAKRLGYGGETTRVENIGKTTTGETTRGKRLGGETSCYRMYHAGFHDDVMGDHAITSLNGSETNGYNTPR